MIQGRIGNINNIDQFNFFKEPVICTYKWCTCHTDIATRKVSDIRFINLIDNSKKRINKISNADMQRIDVGQ